MLAHELRNPLAPIRTATEVLARTLPAQDHNRATADLVKRQVTHLTRLVDDLLDVSRITQGRIQLQHTTLDLSTIVAQAIEATESMLREKHHVVSRLSDLQPLYVNGDAARLLQCVTNLLTNAAKYTDPGGDIRIQLRREQEQAVLSVSDNGIGIAPELLPNIFELFVQSERSLDRSQGGLGIGLSVVQRLVRMHGGSVTATSAGHGKGATFEIRLPRVAPPQAAVALPLQPKVAARSILVVDDNADAADSLAALLRLDGHKVQSVYSAAAALQAIRSVQPAIVLLDIGLPEMDGYQVAREIRATTAGIRLVALTGYGQAEDIARTRAAGFDAHLVKPVDFEALGRAIVPDAPRALSH
jgi:CheY-like chemotaxis protein